MSAPIDARQQTINEGQCDVNEGRPVGVALTINRGDLAPHKWLRLFLADQPRDRRKSRNRRNEENQPLHARTNLEPRDYYRAPS